MSQSKTSSTFDNQAIQSSLELIQTRGFDASVAIGFDGRSKRGLTTWFVCHFKNGKASVATVSEHKSTELADKIFSVDISISAKESYWIEAAGSQDSVLTQIHDTRYTFAGRFPFFVRHIPSVVSIIQQAAGALK